MSVCRGLPLRAVVCRSLPLRAVVCRSLPLRAVVCRSLPLLALLACADRCIYIYIYIGIGSCIYIYIHILFWGTRSFSTADPVWHPRRGSVTGAGRRAIKSTRGARVVLNPWALGQNGCNLDRLKYNDIYIYVYIYIYIYSCLYLLKRGKFLNSYGNHIRTFGWRPPGESS